MTTLAELIADTWFPFAGDISVKPLDDKVIPEPDRAGLDEATCNACQRADDTFVWTDHDWRLSAYLPTQIPGIVLLQTRAHYDSFTDLPQDLLADVGPMTARVERVLLGLGDVAGPRQPVGRRRRSLPSVVHAAPTRHAAAARLDAADVARPAT